MLPDSKIYFRLISPAYLSSWKSILIILSLYDPKGPLFLSLSFAWSASIVDIIPVQV